MEYEGWTKGCDKTWEYICAPPIKKRRRIDELKEVEDDVVSSSEASLNENASLMVETLNVSGECLLQTS